MMPPGPKRDEGRAHYSQDPVRVAYNFTNNFDPALEDEVYKVLCTENTNTGDAIPIYCNGRSDNFTDYPQEALPARLWVELPDPLTGETQNRSYWPENQLARNCDNKAESEEALPRANPEFCTLDLLVVIPSTGFHNKASAFWGPIAYHNFATSFINAILIQSDMGDSDFSPGISLATESCENRCLEGYQCMPSLDLALTSQGSLGRCQKCERGSFCPEGTLHDGGLALGSARLNNCPAGFFCPTPSEAYLCPQGHFCPLGSERPYSCDGINVNGVDFKGNFCPVLSRSPFGQCFSGIYCPNASTWLPCPEGSYCDFQSVEPKPCPSLSKCPAGSMQPSISLFVLVGMGALFGCIFILLIIISIWIKISQRQILKRARKAEKQSTLLKAIGVKLGLGAEQMSYASNLKGFSKNITLVDIVVRNFCVRMNARGKSKVALSNVNVTFGASTLNVILGSSGAGKTTFLKSLVGKFSDNAHPQGEIRFEFKNHPIKVDLIRSTKERMCLCSRSMTKLRARETAVKLGVGYVAQDNVVHEILTVNENIAYCGRLRLGPELSAEAKKEIIQDTITILGLNHIQNAKVGNPHSPAGSISGGEARRVSIGLELVACPSLLILDEPTSGLDAVAAGDVMSSLNKMSDVGVTVVASLHQPRYATFLLFDSLHLFMRGGYVVYSGATSAALDYFTKIGFKLPENENPADFMLDVIAGLIDLPNNPNFRPLDLAEMWERETKGLLSGSPSFKKRQERMWNEFESDETLFLSKDDSCLSARSQSYLESPSNKAPLKSFMDVDLGRKQTPNKLKRSASVVPTPRWLETLGEQFDQLDSHREGYVDSTNMLNLLQSMGQKCTMEEANQIVKHFDVDGDGRIMRKDFLLRWTRNYWTREFSTALLGLFPSSAKKETGSEFGSSDRSSLPAVDELSVSTMSTVSPPLPSSRETAIEMNPLHRSEVSNSKHNLLGSARNLISQTSGDIKQFLSKKDQFVFRSPPGFFKQCYFLLQREPLKTMRMLDMRLLDAGSMAIIALGYAFVNRDMIRHGLEAVKQANTVAMMFVGCLSSLWGALFISREMPMVQREASEGVSIFALFTTLNIYNTAVDLLIRSLAYSLPFFYITGYNMTFLSFFVVCFGTAWSCSAIGMLLACVTDARSAIVLSVSVTFLFGAVLNGVRPSIKELEEASNPLLYWMVFPSYNRWATEALTISEESANAYFTVVEKVQMKDFGYGWENWLFAVLFLYVSGFVLRVCSFGLFYKKAME